jgi:cytochrome c oxidase cbb3-type subunit 3
MKKTFFNINRIILVALSMLAPLSVMAQNKAAETMAPAAENASMFTGSSILLLLTIFTLSAVIYILGRIVKNLIESDTQELAKQNKISKGLLSLVAFMMLSISSFAQDAKATITTTQSSEVFGMDATLFWVMISVLFFEFIIVMYLCKILYVFLVRKNLIQPYSIVIPKWLKFQSMMGNDIPLEKDAELLTDHDYDGIQELDNGMPPFLKYIFITTVIAAAIYWVNYQVLYASPSQLEEYQNELIQAEIQKAEYLKIAGNNVDENTVKLVADVSAGAKIFATTCVACHGDKGQGGVGPNLTDNAWLHGGDIKSIFKTLKYGVVAKGMRAWQSEIKPSDMQSLASYVLTEFKDKNVVGGKAPQGVVEIAASNTVVVDSAATMSTATDTTKNNQ